MKSGWEEPLSVAAQKSGSIGTTLSVFADLRHRQAAFIEGDVKERLSKLYTNKQPYTTLPCNCPLGLLA